jgi:hypothetical protein
MMRWGFFRCRSCFTVIYISREDDIERRGFQWYEERGELYVDNCAVCNHWRYYEPLGDFKRDESKDSRQSAER